jgi:hypothetical protein
MLNNYPQLQSREPKKELLLKQKPILGIYRDSIILKQKNGKQQSSHLLNAIQFMNK